MRATEVQLKDRCAEVEALKAQLAQVQQDAQEQVLVEVQAPLQSAAPQVFTLEQLLPPEIVGSREGYMNMFVCRWRTLRNWSS